ncbi:MAG: prolipoprotein diacylglyceryl transferase [Gemmatimonadetes bacterium]|nr:prolipoprotein diacylglyceryl transferase [Gemmatimonadota bacterium]
MDTQVFLAGPWNAFFAAAVITATALVVRAGRRRGDSIGAWLTVASAMIAGGIIASRLLDFDGVHHAGERTILGGLVGGVTMALVTARVLRWRMGDVLDTLATPTLAGMAIGRIGCFVAGCCHGAVTDLPWAVTYAAGSPAHAQQLAAGLIPAGEAALPVHPVQLYEAGGDLLLLALLPWIRRRVHARGSQLCAMFIGYAFLRFVLEFACGGRIPVPGLNAVQWALAALIGLLGAAFLWRESRAARARAVVPALHVDAARTHERRGADATGTREALAFAVPVMILIAAGTWLTQLESAVLSTAVLATGLAFAVQAVRRMPVLVRSPAFAVAAVMVVVAAQDGSRRSGLSFGAKYLRGSYREFLGTVAIPGSGENCAGGPSTQDVYGERTFQAVGASIDYTRPVTATSDVRLSAAFASGEDLSSDGDPRFPAMPDMRFHAFTLQASVDAPMVGVSVGASFGSLVETGRAMPSTATYGVRVGSLRTVFVEARSTMLMRLPRLRRTMIATRRSASGSAGKAPGCASASATSTCSPTWRSTRSGPVSACGPAWG